MRLVRRVVRLELDLYVALARWVLRRPGAPAGTSPWGYSRLVTPVMALWIFASAMEIPLVHVLTPWEPVRIALLVVSAWGLVWMLSLLASLRVYPHLVDERGLRVRFGTFADVVLPWEAISAILKDERDVTGIRFVRPLETDAGVDLQLVVNGRTNVHVALSRPVSVPYRGRRLEVDAVTFWVDEPRDFIAAVRRELERLTAR